MPKSNNEKRAKARANAIIDMKSNIGQANAVLQNAGHEVITSEERLELDRCVARYMRAVNRYNEAAKIVIAGGPESETSQ